MKSRYKLIIFDCDGVLVDSESISCGVIAKQASQLGHPLTVEEAIHLFAGSSLNKVRKYLEEQLGRTVPDDFESIYRERTYAAFKRDLKPVDGIRDALNQISLPKCVGSNGPKFKIESNLDITGLRSFFKDNLFSAYDIKSWKPKPDLYLLAAKTMGFAPEDCAVVEDSTHGVTAAVAAGMDVFGYAISSKKRAELSEKGAIDFNNMRNLPQLLVEK